VRTLQTRIPISWLTDGQWSNPERIDVDTPSTTDSENIMLQPDLAVGPNGHAVAIWLYYNSAMTGFQVNARSYQPQSNGWGPQRQVGANVGFAEVHVAVDGSGNAVAGWSEETSFGTATFQQATNRFVNGAWGTAAPLGKGVAPQFAFDGSGNAIGIWTRSSPTPARVMAGAMAVNTSQWSTTELPQGGDPVLAANARGQAVAVWVNGASVRDTAGTWGSTIALDTAPISRPAVAIDAKGNAIAIWIAGTNSEVRTRRFTVGSGWDAAPTPLPQVGNLPRIAMDAAGNALAVWSAGANVYAARFTPASGWQEPQLAGTGGSFPSLAVAQNGNAVVMWMQSDLVYANTFQ